jgi:peptide/nickel transport system permease protein
LVIGPGIVLVVAILAINVFGDGLRDGLEPREARALL